MLKVTNPATGDTVGELEEDTAASVAAKMQRAVAAQKGWAKTRLAERKAAIDAFRQALVAQKDALALLLSKETGKPVSQARNEIAATDGRIQFFLDNVAALLNDQVVFENDVAPRMTETITHEPLGVIANISAWNYPYFVGTNVYIPALLVGNAVLYKPSELSSMSGLAMADLLHKAGVPKDVFIPVIGGGAVGAALLEQPLNGVFFTGSYGTGAKIAAAAAKQLMKVQLELGGKDPVYVCEDADVKAAAEGIADGAFYNTGQSCCSVERIYVHEKIYTRFVEHFVATVKGFVTGDPQDDKTYIGPLTRAAQLQVLEAQVQDAQAKGGKVLCGGKRGTRAGSYFEPTVISDATNAMALMRDESFGPIIGIASVKDDDEAVRQMNDTEYGLTAGVYTRERERAARVLGQVNSGTVYWNCCDRVSPRLPWTGRKHSGIGSTLSLEGIRTFLQPKAWHLREV